MSTGIESFGAYIPITRLPHSVIAKKGVKAGGSEKAVAWADEDAITMAVAAGANCLRDLDRSQIDILIFASTSFSFAEKQGASIVAKALDLGTNIKTVDISGSLRAGTLALQQAIDSVLAGSARKVLVLAADCRMAPPHSSLETNLGDGAAAFLVGSDSVIAELQHSASHANDMMDIWRRQGDAFVHSWEERFVNLHGFQESAQAAIASLFEQTGSTAADYTRVCLYAPDARNHAGLAKSMGFATEQLQNPLFGQLGNTGTAFAPMQLIAALQQATQDDSILVVNYGDGADAISFKVLAPATAYLPVRRDVDFHLKRRRIIDSYDKYLSARNLTPSEYPELDDQGISATVQFRNRDENLSLQGQVCNHCGTHQFPKGRVCIRCGTRDHWSAVTYAGMGAKVLTYTFDAFYPSPEPPTVATLVEVKLADGSVGPRIHMQFADATASDMRTGLEVEFTLRVIHRAGKRPNYFWKCLPIGETA